MRLLDILLTLKDNEVLRFYRNDHDPGNLVIYGHIMRGQWEISFQRVISHKHEQDEQLIATSVGLVLNEIRRANEEAERNEREGAKR